MTEDDRTLQSLSAPGSHSTVIGLTRWVPTVVLNALNKDRGVLAPPGLFDLVETVDDALRVEAAAARGSDGLRKTMGSGAEDGAVEIDDTRFGGRRLSGCRVDSDGGTSASGEACPDAADEPSLSLASLSSPLAIRAALPSAASMHS